MGMNEWMRCEADGGGRREQRLGWLAVSGQWTRQKRRRTQTSKRRRRRERERKK